MIVVPGPASRELARSVASLLKARTVEAEFRLFPDGESYVRLLGKVAGERVAIIQTTGPPQDSRLVQAFLLTATARDHGAAEISVVAPYLAYARQDRRFLEGEPVSVITVLDMLKTCGASELITVNAHNPDALKRSKLKCRDLSAFPLLAEFFRNRGFAKALALGLGKRGEAMAAEASDVLQGNFAAFETKRDPKTGEVVVERPEVDLRDHVVILFDDIISTGSTMAKAVEIARNAGARAIFVACVHALLLGNALRRIMDSGARQVVGTDTIPSSISAVSVAPLLADALRR